MTLRARTRRWLVVVVGIALLVAVPRLVQALPVGAAGVDAATLLQRIQGSSDVPYSGYAESDGGLALPVTSQFTSLANLFGGHTQLRTWWRSATDWRVDSIGFTGETDTHASDQGFWTWNYESNTATFTVQVLQPRVRLPNEADLLPPQLARRLLSEARAGDVSRIPDARVAGIDAAGLRMSPHSAISTISRIDVWADPASGLPVRIQIYGSQRGAAALSSQFLDLNLRPPAAATTAFTLPRGANVHSNTSQDLASAIDQFGGVAPPDTLAGIARNPELPTIGSVGVYGRAVTEFLAVPLPRRVGFTLRDQLAPAAGQPSSPYSDESDLAISSGPINLLLTGVETPGGPWLLVGTVTAATLSAAAAGLPSQPRGR